MAAISPFLWKSVIPDCTARMWNSMKTFSTYVMSVSPVSQYLRKNWKTNSTCSVRFIGVVVKVWFTWIIPGLVISLLDCGSASTGGVKGLEEVFLKLARFWPWVPVWPGTPPPPPASLSSGLDSPENWKEKIFALKVCRNYANSERGTIRLKFSNPISLKLNLILILSHLGQIRFTNPDKTL